MLMANKAQVLMDSISMFLNHVFTPLTKLHQQSLSSGELPDIWKQAHVILVFKKVCKSQAANYRPISLTSIFVKVLEYIIQLELVQQQHFEL